jgi:hypothetical protein
MRSLLLIILIAFCAGCRPTDVEPQEVISFSYRSDGSRRIMPVAVPKVTTKLSVNTATPFSTTPLPLSEEKGFVIGTQQGEIVIFGENDSVKSQTTLARGDAIYRLTANKDIIIALHNSGSITAIGYDGKIRWQVKDSASRADMNLAGNAVLRIDDKGIQCFDANSGKQHFQIASTLTPVSAASDCTAFYVALSWNAAAGSDSIYKIAQSGIIERRWGFQSLRITSNIAVAGEQKDRLVFGAQGEVDASGVRRRTFIIGYDLKESTAKQLLRQELEYIATNVSVVNDIALSSGFQMAGEDYSGAIDAFLISSNEKMWQRRFTQPLATPVAVTTQHAFFTLSFASKADIPSNALFYALDLPDGRTAREVSVIDAKNGFVPGLPIPYKGALLLADAANNTIYKLTTE